MAEGRKKQGAKPDPPAAGKDTSKVKTTLKLRRVAGGKDWELVHPACSVERADDLEEVQGMLAAGEIDIARDELVWLLEGCRDFVTAHKLLGELAAVEEDFKLARAHFGYAWQIGVAAFPPRGLDAPLPYSQPANQAFLEAGKGLAWCLKELGQTDLCREVLQQLVACDPSDPLGAKSLLGE